MFRVDAVRENRNKIARLQDEQESLQWYFKAEMRELEVLTP